MTLFRVAAVLLSVVAVGCSGTPRGDGDAGEGPSLDSGVSTDGGGDSGTGFDAGPGDDDGGRDAGSGDAGAPDASVPDAGAPLSALGVDCTADAGCASGFCVDGVCCESACTGLCSTCSGADAGRCVAAAAGLDPRGDCPQESGCGRTGVCDGLGACAFASNTTLCATTACLGGVSTPARSCDGLGGCADAGPPLNCAPYACDVSSGLCGMQCQGQADCLSGYACRGGVCLRAQGETCSADVECASGFCTDGVCCEGRCGGTCERCNASTSPGLCEPVPVGQPAQECAVTAASTCGTTGNCSGARSCQLYSSSTVCAAAQCVSATSSLGAASCSGGGTCGSGTPTSCGAYTCASANGLCHTNCTASADCAPGFECKTSSGQCLRSAGQSCTLGAECLSGDCCAGTCRDLQQDPGNCGACGRVCDTATSTSTCTAGNCQVVSCSALRSNCDADALNGCELNHAAAPNVCATATSMGAACGDVYNASCTARSTAVFATATGNTSKWFSVGLTECVNNIPFCTNTLRHTLNLAMPAGIDFDLYVYSACGTQLQWSTNSGSATETVTLNFATTAANDSRTYWVEVRPFSGAACASWTLTVTGSQ